MKLTIAIASTAAVVTSAFALTLKPAFAEQKFTGPDLPMGVIALAFGLLICIVGFAFLRENKQLQLKG